MNGPGCVKAFGRDRPVTTLLPFTDRKNRAVRILDVVGKFARLSVIPDVTGHAVDGRMGPCGQRGVAHDGFCIGVLVVRVREHGTIIQQVTETSLTETILTASQEVRA